MLFYGRISSKLLPFVPALYFALIGSYDIISDALQHKLSTTNFFFNALLIIPLFWRHRLVHIIFGILCSLFALYGFFVLFAWFLEYRDGAQFHNLFDTFIMGPIFFTLSLFFGLCLVYKGLKPSRFLLRDIN